METETVSSRNVVDLLLNDEFSASICGHTISETEADANLDHPRHLSILPFFAPPAKSQKSGLYDHLLKEAEERFGILPPPSEKPTAPEVPNDTAYTIRELQL